MSPMIKTFTQDDVIRYIYNELTPEEQLEFKNALLCDTDLQEEYKEMKTVTRKLDVFKDPSHRTVNDILRYSRNY